MKAVALDDANRRPAAGRYDCQPQGADNLEQVLR